MKEDAQAKASGKGKEENMVIDADDTKDIPPQSNDVQKVETKEPVYKRPKDDIESEEVVQE